MRWIALLGGGMALSALALAATAAGVHGDIDPGPRTADLREHDGASVAAAHRREEAARRKPASTRNGRLVLERIKRRSDIYSLHPKRGRPRQLTDDRAVDENPVFSPDGHWIAYGRTELEDDRDEDEPSSVIVLMRANGSRARTLTDEEADSSWPAFSPNGKRIVFAREDPGGGNSDLYVMRRDGSRLRRITSGPGEDFAPDWSPDGRRIAFTRASGAGPLLIFTVRPNGRGLKRLTNRRADSDSPTWSPNGKQIAFSRNARPGEIDLYRMRANGSRRRRVTSRGRFDLGPVWARNGRWIAFTSQGARNSDIFTVRPNGRGLRRVTKDGASFVGDWQPRL